MLDEVTKLGDILWAEGRPRWELIVFPNVSWKDSTNVVKTSCVVVVRMHHSYGDGVSFLQFIRHCVLDNSQTRLIIDPVKQLKLTLLKKAVLYTQAIFLGPFMAFQGMIGGNIDNIFCNGEPTSDQKFIGRTTMKIPLEMIRSIRAYYGCRTQSVFHSVFIGALEDIAKSKGLDIPGNIKVAGNQAIFPYPNEFPQNRSCFALHSINTGIASPEERLEHVEKSMITKEYSLVFSIWLLRLIGHYPACVARAALKNFQCDYFLSNIPGIKDNGMLGGEEVDLIFGVAPIGNGIRYGVAVACNNGEFTVGFNVDKSEVIKCREDVQRLVQKFENSLTCLSRQATLVKD